MFFQNKAVLALAETIEHQQKQQKKFHDSLMSKLYKFTKVIKFKWRILVEGMENDKMEWLSSLAYQVKYKENIKRYI